MKISLIGEITTDPKSNPKPNDYKKALQLVKKNAKTLIREGGAFIPI